MAALGFTERCQAQRLGEQPLQMVRLENNLLPSRCYRARGQRERAYQRDGTDCFITSNASKTGSWWKAVKASFPLWNTASASSSQAPGTRKDTQRARFNAWMEFSRHHSIMESTQFGRHSNMLLSKKSASSPMIHGIYHLHGDQSHAL